MYGETDAIIAFVRTLFDSEPSELLCRHVLLALLIAAVALLASCGERAADSATGERPLRLAGPPAVVSFPLMRMAETGITLDGRQVPAQFQTWHGADQLRVLLARGDIDFSAAPTHVPALLANRGEPVRLLNVSVWGMLWLISRDPHMRGFGDLRQRDLLMPYRRDMGAITLQALLDAQGLVANQDVRLIPTRDANDAVSLMLAGRGQQALLPEPTASLLLWRAARSGGAPLYRVQSLEAAWAQQFPQAPELPQAGVMAAGPHADNTRLGAAIVQAYAQAARWCKAQAHACAQLAQRYLPELPLPALESAIRVTRLDGVPARQARLPLEALYRRILAQQPEAIGAALPAEEFYGP